VVDGNIQRRQPLTPFLRGYIEKGSVNNESPADIAIELNIPRSTVYRTLQFNYLRVNGETLPRSDRPTLISSIDERNILRLIRVDPRLRYLEIREALLSTYSDDTLLRLLKRHGITNWRAKRRPLLTPDVAKKRLKWAKDHVNWASDEWRACIWSDECSLERGAGGGRVWVFRTPK